MWHGACQSASWETTSDGREGFQTLFLRRGFPVYVIDQPRRGDAGRSTVEATVEPTPYDQLFFDQFRLGRWPDYFPGVQVDRAGDPRPVLPLGDAEHRAVRPGRARRRRLRAGRPDRPRILVTHSQAAGRAG